MTVHVFVEPMRHEMINVLPIITIPLTLLFIHAFLTYLSERSYEKEIEKRKYKRNLLLSMTAQTKVDLEIKELTTR